MAFPGFPILDSLDSLFLGLFSLILSYLTCSLLGTRLEDLIRFQRNILGRDLSGVVLCACFKGWHGLSHCYLPPHSVLAELG